VSWKVLITASGAEVSGEQAQRLLRDSGCELVFVTGAGPFGGNELLGLLEGKDAALASLDGYSAEVLAAPAAASLKIVARWGVGYDRVDLAAATQNGIVVTYTPGLLDEAVADYTFALLLALARGICESARSVQEGGWKRILGADVAGKTLGVIGCGRIGQAVARRARGFNMRVLAYGPRARPEAEALGAQFVSLGSLLAESDFVSLHAALTSQSRGLIGERELRTMKKTAFLINTARGALLDEAALGRALREQQIAGAALDVFMDEPLPAGNPLRSAPNLLLSPHQSSFARDTGERVSLAAAQAIVDLMRGRRPHNVLNPLVFESPRLRRPLKG